MSEARTMHQQAMQLLEESRYKRQNGDIIGAASLHVEAYHLEKAAAESMRDRYNLEPTRSILFKGAALLALENGLYREAEQLACLGLAGSPRDFVASELRRIMEQANFVYHLAVHGFDLSVSGFQLTLTGNAVGAGKAAVGEVLERYRSIKTLIYRTLERVREQPFKEAINSAIRKEFGIYVTVPHEGSFAAAFEIMQQTKQEQLPGFDDRIRAIDEMMDCFELFEAGDEEQLQKRIPDDSYLVNFKGLAEQIAPDGDLVKFVGITAVRDGHEKTARLSSRPAAAPNTLSQVPKQRRKAGTVVTVTGRLRVAASPEGDAGKIHIIDGANKSHHFQVREGQMTDIVRPMYLEDVVAVGKVGKRGIILLDSIKRAVET